MTNLRVRISGQNFRSGYARGHHSFGDRHFLRHAIDVHPQKSQLPHFPFHINDFQPLRARHPLCARANPLQTHVEPPPPWPVSSAPQPASTKKWACAHSSVRPLQSEFRVYSRSTAKARHQPAVGDRSFCFELSDEPINVAKYPHFAIRPSLNLNTAAPGKRPNRALGKDKTPRSTTPGRLKYDAAKNRRVIAVAVSPQEAEPPPFFQALAEWQCRARPSLPETTCRARPPLPPSPPCAREQTGWRGACRD